MPFLSRRASPSSHPWSAPVLAQAPAPEGPRPTAAAPPEAATAAPPATAAATSWVAPNQPTAP
jgi:hypothetical protein